MYLFNFEIGMYFLQPPKGLDVDSTFLSEQGKTKSIFDYRGSLPNATFGSGKKSH